MSESDVKRSLAVSRESDGHRCLTLGDLRSELSQVAELGDSTLVLIARPDLGHAVEVQALDAATVRDERGREFEVLVLGESPDALEHVGTVGRPN